MPLEWKRGLNPYRNTYFRRLEAGPNCEPRQIVHLERNQKQKIPAGGVLEVGGEALDEHAIAEASSQLRQPASLAEELLLTHPAVKRENKIKKIADTLQLKTLLPEVVHAPIPLRAPEAFFWLTPMPGPEAAALPEWEAFGFPEAGDADDALLDIVFDS